MNLTRLEEMSKKCEAEVADLDPALLSPDEAAQIFIACCAIKREITAAIALLAVSHPKEAMEAEKRAAKSTF